MASAGELRDAYVEELRRILPDIMDWWDGVQAELGPQIAWKRWPTGPGAHPRVLAIFRKYYLQIAALPWENAEDRREEEPSELWGRDDMGEKVPVERPADWLIFDIPTAAPDLKDLVDGLCFLPIGLNDEDAVV